MSATEVIRRHGDHIEKAARAGYIARGIVFVIIGYFAFKAAYSTGRTMDSKDAVSFVFGTVGGKVLLVALVAALAAFAAWRFLQAIRDVDRHGTGAKGVAVRAGLVGSGISYAALAFFAGALAWGAGSASEAAARRRAGSPWPTRRAGVRLSPMRSPRFSSSSARRMSSRASARASRST